MNDLKERARCLERQVETGKLRPPSEAHSLMIRVVRNCPWNRCKFCPAYKGEKFSLRSTDEVIGDIRILAADPANHCYRSVFLQDGDALAAKVDDLLDILAAIRSHLPKVERVCQARRRRQRRCRAFPKSSLTRWSAAR